MTNTDKPTADEPSVVEHHSKGKMVVETVLHTVGAVTNTSLAPTTDKQVAADGGCKPLPPLHDVIDPDALTRFVSESAADVQVTFAYAGCTVTVTDNDTVSVIDQSPPTDAGD